MYLVAQLFKVLVLPVVPYVVYHYQNLYIIYGSI